MRLRTLVKIRGLMRTEDLEIRTTPEVNIACVHVLLASEMHVLDHYASISDQSLFAHIASHIVK